MPSAPAAGFRVRALAFGIDYLVIAGYAAALTGVSLALRAGPFPGLNNLFAHPVSAQITGYLSLTLPVTLYFALMECSPWQATLGKRRLGLRVVTIGGARLSLAQALLRSVLKFLPWELAHTCLWQTPGWPVAPQSPPPLVQGGWAVVGLLVAIYLAGLLAGRRTLYDQISGTVVVLRRAA